MFTITMVAMKALKYLGLLAGLVIPSRQLVVVRMGQTFDPNAWDTEAFLVELLDVLPA